MPEAPKPPPAPPPAATPPQAPQLGAVPLTRPVTASRPGLGVGSLRIDLASGGLGGKTGLNIPL